MQGQAHCLHIRIYVTRNEVVLVGFADLDGTSRSRVTAYVVTALAAMPLIVIGTLASGSVWMAVATSVIVGFALSIVGVLGGYFLNPQTALILAFVLAVINVASIEALAGRITGWVVGGVVAVLAGWLIWPRSSHLERILEGDALLVATGRTPNIEAVNLHAAGVTLVHAARSWSTTACARAIRGCSPRAT